MASLTSLPDSNYADLHTGGPNGMQTLFCPDCGARMEHIGTASFENAWCFTCINPDHERRGHWVRDYNHVDYVKIAECEICREEPV